MGTRVEAVFDGNEALDVAYDPLRDYVRQQTLIRLSNRCCHVCLRSPPEIAFVHDEWAYKNVKDLEPCCTECMTEIREDLSPEEDDFR